MNTQEGAESARLDNESAGYVESVSDRLENVLGANLVGLYLHGSAALGDFSQARSDVDLLAVASHPVTREEKQHIAEELSSAALPCPASGLEFHLVTRASLETPTQQPPFEIHVATQSGEPDKVVDGNNREGDPDLVMHFAVLHEYGVPLRGPAPKKLFPPIPREWLLKAFADELRWAEVNASPAYQVLNACRAWRFVEEDAICSKTEGAEWARQRLADPAVIDQALQHRRGTTDAYPDEERTKSLLDEVQERLADRGRRP